MRSFLIEASLARRRSFGSAVQRLPLSVGGRCLMSVCQASLLFFSCLPNMIAPLERVILTMKGRKHSAVPPALSSVRRILRRVETKCVISLFFSLVIRTRARVLRRRHGDERTISITLGSPSNGKENSSLVTSLPARFDPLHMSSVDRVV